MIHFFTGTREPSNAIAARSPRAARLRSLVYSVYDGFFYSCMIGLGESYFSAYALFLGATNFQIGMLASFPPFIAGLSQFKTLSLMKKIPSRKTLVCAGVFMQALSFVPLVLAFYFPVLRVELYIVLVTLYFTCNAIIGPIWNSWMGDLVASSQRSLYFGRRNRVITIGTFFTLTAAGFALRTFSEMKMELLGFLFIFSLAFCARILSLYYLSRKYDPPQTLAVQNPEGFFKFVKNLRHKNQGTLVIYMALVNFAVYLSAAYFTPLMIRGYKFDYLTYTILISGTALAKFLSFSGWGEICDKLGPRKVLRACGFLISFTTIPWLFTTDPRLLFLCQCYTGLVWAGYELSTFTFLLDATEPEERARVSSYLNILTATAGFIGGLLGALVFIDKANSLHAYMIVFAASSLVRVTAFMAFGRKLKEVRVIAPVKATDVIFKAWGFKSAMGLTSRLVVFAKDRVRPSRVRVPRTVIPLFSRKAAPKPAPAAAGDETQKRAEGRG